MFEYHLTVLKLVVSLMAAWQIVETLRHGSVFLWLRRWANGHLDHPALLVRKAATLANCPFCLSHWAPLFPLAAMCYGPVWIRFLMVSLALTRAAQLLNDLTHSFSHSPPSGEELEIDETDQA
jgi:hypothetical protein